MSINKHKLISALAKPETSNEVLSIINAANAEFTREKGVMPNQIYRECKSKGISLTFEPLTENEPSVLSAIHLDLIDCQNSCVFNGWIGDNLTDKHTSINNIKKLYGEPSKFGGGEYFMGRKEPYWLRYDNDEYLIHFEFSDDKQKIVQVTLMPPGAID